MGNVVDQARWLRDTVGVRAFETGALRVSGPEARSWLNGQITNDVSRTSAGDSIYALLLDLHGKILTDLWVLDQGHAFQLLLLPGRLDAIMEHLDRYVVMEDVELEGRTIEIVSAQGPRADRLAPGGWACDRLGGGGEDYLDSDLQSLTSLATELGGGAVSQEAWELARLRAGSPAYGRDFDASCYPQEAGLRDTAVSFTKGCYLGQEVVCMLESRGQLRRRLVQLRGDRPPAVGAALRDGDREVGAVRSAILDPEDGRAWAHAFVKRRSATVGRTLESPVGTMTIRKVIGSGSAPGAL